MCDLLSQTYPMTSRSLSKRLSYGIWTQAQGSTPIIIQPDGDHDRYLDTHGGP
jgi:hypothetical protein